MNLNIDVRLHSSCTPMGRSSAHLSTCLGALSKNAWARKSGTKLRPLDGVSERGAAQDPFTHAPAAHTRLQLPCGSCATCSAPAHPEHSFSTRERTPTRDDVPAVERPGELGPPVLAVVLGMAAVLLLLLLANSAISGALGSLFTKKCTAAKLPCRDLRGVFKGKVVMYELHGFLHELTRCSLSCTPMAAKTWGMHCTGQSQVQDMHKVADMAGRVLDRISVMASAIVDDSGAGRLIVCLEGKNPLKQVGASRTAAKAKAAAEGKWLNACHPTDYLVRAVLGQMETKWPGCTSMAPGCSVWVVWPCHDADGQLAMHVLSNEDAYAIVESNDSDMLCFPDVRNMVFAFSLNAAGGMKGFVCPNDCTDEMYARCKMADGEQGTLQAWDPHKRLAAAVLSGCDCFKLSGVGMARAALIVDKLWDAARPMLDNLLAVQAAVVEGPTTLAPAAHHGSAVTTLNPTNMKVAELKVRSARSRPHSHRQEGRPRGAPAGCPPSQRAGRSRSAPARRAGTGTKGTGTQGGHANGGGAGQPQHLLRRVLRLPEPELHCSWQPRRRRAPMPDLQRQSAPTVSPAIGWGSLDRESWQADERQLLPPRRRGVHVRRPAHRGGPRKRSIFLLASPRSPRFTTGRPRRACQCSGWTPFWPGGKVGKTI